MKAHVICVFPAVLLIAFICLATAGEEDLAALIKRLRTEVEGKANLNANVKEFVKDKLLPVCSNPVLVAETKSQNAEGVSLDQIKQIDAQWQVAEEELPVMTEKLENECAIALKQICAGIPAVKEVFVMDNQGAIVGENNLTSDYWQGDEPKFINSYNNGQGGVDAGDEKFDRSANAVIQQISLPVVDSDGTVVGAITFGISVSSL